MKPETMKLLESWKNEVLKPTTEITINKDYCPCDDGTVELIWFANYQRDGVDHALWYKVSNVPDDIGAINIRIDVAEQVELKKCLS